MCVCVLQGFAVCMDVIILVATQRCRVAKTLRVW